jgi:hypothetical protein
MLESPVSWLMVPLHLRPLCYFYVWGWRPLHHSAC